MAIEQDLNQLEVMLRQLQIEWEKFFGRVEKKPPHELKAKVEGIIRRYAYEEMRNNNERFRYQSMAARYASFSELWNKRLRAFEEGRTVGVHGHLPPPTAPAPSPAAAGPARAAASGAGAGEIRVRNPDKDESAVRALYDQFLQARQQAGEKGTVKYDSFQKLIGQQATRILSDKGGQAVEFRLETKDGKVSLKAKVVK